MIQRVAIVGGSGFIGSRLALDLMGAGFQVTIFDREPAPSELVPDCEVIPCDILSDLRLLPQIREFDVVFLLAGVLASRCREDPALGWETNVLGTGNVLRELLESRRVRRVIFASTGMIYATPAREYPLNEAAEVACSELYATSKIAGEAMLHALAQATGLQSVILRFFTVYGPGPASGERGHFIAHWMERVKQGEPLIIHGNGAQTVDLVHITDVVSGCRRAMEVEMPPGAVRTYNIAGGTESRVRDIAQWMQQVEPTLRVEFDPNAYVGSSRRFADITRAARELSYEPGVSPEEGIKKLLKLQLQMG
ncbi:MAG: NAD(P)-dependent oxidoreductase [Armatimonadetes bacterium]|nr:NAD(P)-dependent oxidoreductase [Armatimonadota bacterium]